MAGFVEVGLVFSGFMEPNVKLSHPERVNEFDW